MSTKYLNITYLEAFVNIQEAVTVGGHSVDVHSDRCDQKRTDDK